MRRRSTSACAQAAEKVPRERRAKRRERERAHLLAQTVYLGTLGVMLALPIVVGAYLGSWLDEPLYGLSR